MASPTVRDKILSELERLPETSQRQVLEIVRTFPSPTPAGTPIESLFAFAGSLDDESAHEMETAIEAGCEQVDLDAW